MSTENPHEMLDDRWEVVNLSEIKKKPIAPYRIFAIPSIREFDIIEQEVCHAITSFPHGGGSDYTMSRESTIAKDRISNHLRPRGFSGSLVGGYATILPFDRDRALYWATKNARPNLAKTQPEHALNVLFTGVLKVSRVGVLGQVCLEAAYYEPPSSDQYRDSFGRLRRVAGYSEYTRDTKLDMEEILQKNTEASQRRARKLTVTALRHVYGAGAPGLGKRS